jgi:hypothetical protein
MVENSSCSMEKDIQRVLGLKKPQGHACMHVSEAADISKLRNADREDITNCSAFASRNLIVTVRSHTVYYKYASLKHKLTQSVFYWVVNFHSVSSKCQRVCSDRILSFFRTLHAQKQQRGESASASYTAVHTHTHTQHKFLHKIGSD